MDAWFDVALAALFCMGFALLWYHQRCIANEKAIANARIADLENRLSAEKEARESESLAYQKRFLEFEGRFIKLIEENTELQQKNDMKIADVKEQLTAEKRRVRLGHALRVLDLLFAWVKMVGWFS